MTERAMTPEEKAKPSPLPPFPVGLVVAFLSEFKNPEPEMEAQ